VSVVHNAATVRSPGARPCDAKLPGVCNQAGVFLFTEPPGADGERFGAGAVLWEAARVAVLQVHAGRRGESHVWVLQVSTIIHYPLFTAETGQIGIIIIISSWQSKVKKN